MLWRILSGMDTLFVMFYCVIWVEVNSTALRQTGACCISAGFFVCAWTTKCCYHLLNPDGCSISFFAKPFAFGQTRPIDQWKCFSHVSISRHLYLLSQLNSVFLCFSQEWLPCCILFSSRCSSITLFLSRYPLPLSSPRPISSRYFGDHENPVKEVSYNCYRSRPTSSS